LKRVHHAYGQALIPLPGRRIELSELGSVIVGNLT
jgi:hypothetical protein